MIGGETTEQGDCSKFSGYNTIPHCSKRNPAVVDLLPGTPYNQQSANCCKGGVINSLVQDLGKAISSFQLSVGGAGTTNRTVRLPLSSKSSCMLRLPLSLLNGHHCTACQKCSCCCHKINGNCVE
ncbi:hypothetical protein KY285_007206 [Solanum tuberosum]|nr:hypothetical protein KY285_007206 [Solanum tuberosum]